MNFNNNVRCFLVFLSLIIGMSFVSCTKSVDHARTLSTEDKEAIEQLRNNIISAILTENVNAYADLCTDDVRLLHPGSPIITGREELINHIAPMFEAIKVTSLILTPVEIYGIGDLAYEVGTQSAAIEPSLEGFGSSRKYLHVMRRSENGKWRFVALMSSDS